MGLIPLIWKPQSSKEGRLDAYVHKKVSMKYMGKCMYVK